MSAISGQIPKTLQEAVLYFSNELVCIEAVSHMRWMNGVECPSGCWAEKAPFFMKTQKRWKCRECRRQFSVKVNTIFEDSPISLTKWLPALWLIVNSKNGISSYEIARALGVTQKTAWFMLHRLRLALKNGSLAPMGESGGPVEVDETHIGPKLQKMHRERRLALKTDSGDHKVAVMGLLDRDTRQVRAKVVPNVKRETLQREILKQVAPGGLVYTDRAVAYDNLEMKAFVHETVNHVEEYVRGNVHTQGIENFWSLLKRGLNGTYIAVEPFHLDRYVDEQVFRFNNRATKENPLDDADRFLIALSQVSNKRLTYAELTGKDVSTTPV
jgi:transposase-like protein